MSWWDQNICDLVRIDSGEYGLKVPFSPGSRGIDTSNKGFYSQFSLRLRRADDEGCCDDSCGCCQDVCCNCSDEKPKSKNGFEIFYRALSFTSSGELYFRFDDQLFKRGTGRYEGMLVRGEGKNCDAYDELCSFVLMIDNRICLDWSRAKGVELNTNLLGSCTDG